MNWFYIFADVSKIRVLHTLWIVLIKKNVANLISYYFKHVGYYHSKEFTLCHFVLVFFSPIRIAITSLGEERANLSAFRTFVRFVLVWICRFPLPLGVWEGLRFVIVAFPGLFSYLFCSLWELFVPLKSILKYFHARAIFPYHLLWQWIVILSSKDTNNIKYMRPFYLYLINLPLI